MAFRGLGMAHLILGNKPEALKNFRKYLENDPDDRQAKAFAEALASDVEIVRGGVDPASADGEKDKVKDNGEDKD